MSTTPDPKNDDGAVVHRTPRSTARSPRPAGLPRAFTRAARAVGAVVLVLASLALSAHPAGAQTAPKPTPTLITTASGMVPVGGQIFANANLLGVSNPTGTLTFQLYGPGDTTCTTAIFTSVVAVTGTSVNSSRYTTTHAGTYRWTSTYSGDATFSAAGPTPCSGGSESVLVDRARVVLSLQAEAPSGGTIRDSVTVSGGFAPSGTLTFALSGPADTFCSAPPVFTSTVAVNGTGTYRSEPYRPVASGTYRWRVTYSGDTNNRGVSWTGCFEPTQAVDFTTVATSTEGDYDGDGKADYAVYRPATGMWYLDRSSAADSPQYWGMAGDVSAPGDYDGDGKADYAVYRPATGMWYVQTSTGALRTQSWGAAGDVPVPGDYDGDGKADYAVFRPASATWFVMTAAGSVRTQYWGGGGDVPVPADYDGDGKADYAVFRPASGAWYSHLTTGRDAVVGLGAAGDRPVALPHAIWSKYFGADPAAQ